MTAGPFPLRTLGCLLAATLVLFSAFAWASAPPASRASVSVSTFGVSEVRPSASYVPVMPRWTPASIPVGAGPDALVVDSPNDTLFVANEYANNVSEVSLNTGKPVGAIAVGSQPCPGCLALDAANGTVYVANSGSNNVTAISAALGGVSATIPTGSFPDAILYNPGNRNVYVADAGSGEVTVIASVTNNRTLTVPVGLDPVALALDSVNHNVLVAVSGSNNLTILSGLTSVPLAVVTVGNHPDAIGYDAAHNDVYVANAGSDNVSVLGADNHTILASIPVGSGPSAVVVDPARSEVFVANRFSGNVSVISTISETVVATLVVGGQPGTYGAMAYYPKNGAVFVANSGSNNVSVLTDAPPKAAGAIPVLSIPQAIALNASSGRVYVANFGSANVSVFSVDRVTFRASGLPAGSNWSVSAGAPSLLKTNTTYRASGSIAFFEPNGTLPYAVTPPAGYGLARAVGPRGTTQSVANLSGAPRVVVRLVFGPLLTLYVNETGLPAGTVWGVTISSGFVSGGASSQNGTTNGTSIHFTVVKGPWKYTVTSRPTTYRPTVAHGGVRIGTGAASASIRFLLVGQRLVFSEKGLPLGTRWGVNISGPQSASLSGTGSALSVSLGNGSYTFVVWNFSTLHPNTGGTPHDQGSFTVVAPGLPIVERTTYSPSP